MTQSIKLRAVLAGDDVVTAVQGGYIRRPASEDGILVCIGADEVFLPEAKLAEALTALDRLRTTPALSRPMRAAQMELPSAAQKLGNKG